MNWIEECTVGEFFDRRADEIPHQKALITPLKGDYTFGELKQISDLLGRGMMDLGVDKGDRVAVWANNIPEWVSLFLSISKIGAIMVPLHMKAHIQEIRYDLKQADVNFLFLAEGVNNTNYSKILHEAIPDLQVLPSGDVQSKEFPYLKKVVTIGESTITEFLTISEVISKASNISESQFRHRRKNISPLDTIIIKFTCGLSGDARGAMLTHFGLINNAQPIVRKLNLGTSDILCMPIPFFYIFGFWMGLMVTFSSQTSMVTVHNYNALDVLKMIEKYRCTALYGVPTIFSDLLHHPSFSNFDLSSMRTGMMSGAFCPPELLQQTIKEMQISELTVLYGITEVGALTQSAWNDSNDDWIYTVGQPLDGMEMKVIDLESGVNLPPDYKGEICVRSPVIMKGYYNMPTESSQIIDKEGWFHTGDLGTVDEKGYYRITGRRRNMIIRGGENIYPKEVEKYLRTYSGVLDARVVGVPSRRLGEEVYAFVKPENGSNLSAQSIREYLKKEISPHQIPRWVKIMDEFPNEKNGNIDRNFLRQWVIRELKYEDRPSLEIIYDGGND